MQGNPSPKERPILMSGPMVRAILDGAKTQTRRVIKPHPQPGSHLSGGVGLSNADGKAWAIWDTDELLKVPGNAAVCPYGRVGDRLWVRETFTYYSTGYYERPDMGVFYGADGMGKRSDPGRWRNPIHMPRAMSRITLEICDIRAERVQDISEADIHAEGVLPFDCIYSQPLAKRLFQELWNSINGDKPGSAWADNPWVWGIVFRRVEQEAEQ